MPEGLTPPEYVIIPSTIVYSDIPNGPARTLIQIIGLHWDKKRLPRITFEELMTLTGNTRSTLYGHLAYLRTSGWLPFNTAADGTFQFDLSRCGIQNTGQSKKLDDSIKLSDSIDIELINNNGASKNLDTSKKLDSEDKKQRDPLLDNEAVKLLRSIAHITANHVQRKMIAESVTDFDAWSEALNHWLGHGWKPTNIVGMLESYKRGGRSACTMCTGKNGNGHKPAQSAPKDPDLAYLRDNPKAKDRQDVIRALQSRGAHIPAEILTTAERIALEGAKP